MKATVLLRGGLLSQLGPLSWGETLKGEVRVGLETSLLSLQLLSLCKDRQLKCVESGEAW